MGKKQFKESFHNPNLIVDSDSDEENDYPFDDGYKCIIF